ncbi:M4 family peptidase [Pseudoxanthomonas gei]|uniref:Neutral metalloproteinase n=1 Tax=Pseudoxanthomonas gei TaxID=1383030 RepID=A0ABX0AD04_9GAMM|nr:M4 family metallopeptidase [Pseudoxanthomonas gei]NDK37406.1 M4 family peptidase [Pseudoxanthomonas gei]
MTASKSPRAAPKRAAKPAPAAASKPTARKALLPENGMSGFSIDLSAAGERAKLAALPRTRSAMRVASGPALDLGRLDPETAASHYLDQALESREVRKFSRPVAGGVPSDFKSLGTEVSPLTGTTLVKFRQHLNKIPVYGSLVVVELGADNQCLAINSSIGTPKAVANVAKVAPAEALAVAAKAAGVAVSRLAQTPRLNYYFDQRRASWKLVYIVEDVRQPVTKAGRRGVDASVKDYVVDALTGSLLAALPRIPAMSAVHETVVDALGRARTIAVEKTGSRRRMHDSTLNLTTYGFRFRDPTADADKLPGSLYKNPPKPWPLEAIGAHANVAETVRFLRDVLKRNNIDNRGGEVVSTVNCWDREESTGTDREWRNAYWNGEQMVYGQVAFPDGSMLSIASMLDVVAHELFHGVTEATSRLEYQSQAGALNESYSDIFGVIISNRGKPVGKWTWEVGRDFNGPGTFLRSLADPTRFDQPRHMRNFRRSVPPYTYERNDYGWVHDNSGIHNFAAYKILTRKRGSKFLFSPEQVAAMFFLALTIHLSRTSDFAASRRAVLAATRSLFRKDPPATLKYKVAAVASAFAAVGIK